MLRCHKPLAVITDCDGRFFVQLDDCSSCTKPPTELVIMQGGCVEYEQKVEYTKCQPRSFGCCTPQVCSAPQVKLVEKPRATLVYPLHEVDDDNRAVFVLDGKLKALGYGRYTTQINFDDCPPYEFDIDYTCGVSIGAITTGKVRGCV